MICNCLHVYVMCHVTVVSFNLLVMFVTKNVDALIGQRFSTSVDQGLGFRV